MSNDANKIWTWDELDIHTVTNLYLYGTAQTPAHYVDRLRLKAEYDALINNDGDKVMTIKVDAVSYMNDGPGRYASPSQAPVVDQFFNGQLTLANGIYTAAELQLSSYGISRDDFKISVAQYQINAGDDDYLERTYVFNNSGFILSDDTEFIVTSTGVSMSNVKIRPFDDDFDFETSDFFTSLADQIILGNQIDPYDIGVKLDFVFTNKDNIAPINNYDYEADLQNYNNSVDGSLLSNALPAMLAAVILLKNNGTIEYDTPSGGKVVYGSVEDDASVTGTVYGDIIVVGDGDDTVFGTIGDDKIFGGSAEYNSSNDTLSYANVTNGLNVLFTAPAETGTIYTQGLKILGNNFTYTDLAYGFEKLILTGAADRVRFTNGDLSQNYFIDGSGDIDTLDFSGMTSSVTVDVIKGTTNGSITFSDFEEFIGGSANDTFIDAAGKNEYDGLAGLDTLSYAEQDLLQASSGQSGIRIEADLAKGEVDRFLISGGQKELDTITNIEQIIGASGDDVFKGKEGVVGQGFTGNGQTTERGDNVDFSDYAATKGGITVDLNAQTGSDGNNGTYTLTGLEQVIGTNAADSITGDGNNNWLFGNGGDDSLINGGGGDDRIVGGAGNDILEGGADNDTFYIAASGQQPMWLQTGIDTITDGSGANDIVYLLGGYQFNLNSFTYAGTQLSISGAANITNSTDIEFVEYSDGAKFRVDRLILDEADATTFAASGATLSGDGASNTLSASGSITLVNGNGGDDWLRGFESNDLTLDGGAGSDYLFGFSGNTLNGGSGNDYLDGQLNNNVKYQTSSGIDVIKDGGANGNLEVSGAYTLWKADNGSLVVDYSGASNSDEVIASTNKAVILDYFNGQGIETINNVAVSTMSFKQLGTSIDDYLTGGTQDDNFSASKGDDIYDGGTGANQFNFSVNDTGSTVVRTTPDAQADLLIFNGLDQIDVSVIRDASIGTDNLLFSYGQSFAIVENAALDIANANNVNVQFADTSALTFASIDLTTRGSNQADTLDGDVPGFSVDDIIFGGAGDDIINGNSGNDTIYGGVGNDIIDSGAGSDTIFDGFGDDTYTVGKGDRVVLGSGENIIDFGGYDAASGDSSTTYMAALPQNIALSDTFLWRDASGTTILDYGANSVALAATFNPIIDFANDPDLTLEQMVLTTIGDGSDENIIDAIYGYLDASNVFQISGQQDDIIYANGGNDDVVVTGGNDIVYGGAGNDVIGVGINPQNEVLATGYVKFYGEGGNDVLGITDLSGELYGGAGNDELVGGVGIDTLDGGAGNDWISAQGGDDTVYGGAGDDTILGLVNGAVTVDAGDGNDIIVLETSADDIIDGGAGMDIVSFESIFALTTAQIDLSSQSANMDGTNYSFTSIEGVIGSQGDDTITGSSANNIIDGGAGFGGFLAGNDLLKGEGGDDTYFFGTSFNPRTPPSAGSVTPQAPVVGDDIVDDASGSSDTIEFSDYFVLSDLSFNMVGSNLVISFAEGSVTILNQTGSGKVENIKFSDGSVLNLDDYAGWIVGTPDVDNLTGTADNQTLYGVASDDILNAYISGSALAGGLGNDTLNGNAGNDTLVGGAGNDTIFGGAGDDVYLFSPGDGFDVISDTSGFDTLSILDAITFSDLVFTKVGNDLQIDIASGVTIADFYSGDPNLILEQIQFSDGTSFDLTTLLAPVAGDDIFVADQDTVVTGNLLVDNGNGADSDPDGGILSVVAGTFATTNGSVTISTNGDFTYTPNAGYIGVDSFTYTLDDGQGNSDIGTANITLNYVAPPNNPPLAQDDVFSGNQDLDVTGNLLADNGNGVDSDPDGDAIGIVAETIVTANGSVVIAANGDFTYTPNAGYIGADSFTYTLQDSFGATDTALASITINASANSNPVAVADSFAGNEDLVISGNVLTNDSDVNGDTLSVTAATLTTVNGGAVSILADGSFTYIPAADFNGTDSFAYTLLDGQGGSDTGTVTLNVAAVNDAPVAINDSATTNEDTVVTINVLSNDSDIEGDTLSVTSVGGAINGTVIVNVDNTLTYTPNADFNGSETLTYTISDGNGGITTANINVTINPVNDNPIATDDSFSGNEGSVITGNVLSNDTDADSDALSVTPASITTVNGGSVDLLADGSFTYIPATGYNGSDSFNYTLLDGTGLSDAGTVNIDITSANIILGTSGDDYLTGTSGDDVFYGQEGNDFLNGGTGNDILNGGTGNDILYGSSGNDILDGGLGDDILRGHNGDDTYLFSLGQGDDVVIEQGGNDKILFGPGVTANDLSFIRSGWYDLTIQIDQTVDYGSLTIQGQFSGGVVETLEFNDGSTLDLNTLDYTYIGSSANETIYGVRDGLGGSGVDTLYGNDGDDIIRGTGVSGYSYTAKNTIYGGDGNDTLYADAAGDYLDGGADNDVINGGVGVDTLIGGTGDDILKGGRGNDTYIFNYGDGNDLIEENRDNDTILFGAGITAAMLDITRLNINDVIINVDGGLGGSIELNWQTYGTGYIVETVQFDDGSTLDLTSLDLTLNGTSADETLYGVRYGGSGVDTIYGNDGDDIIYGYRIVGDYIDNSLLSGGNGNDTIYGANGIDTILGGSGADTLKGNGGDDIISGNDGSDYIYGGTGNDILSGGAGVDMLYGQGGADVFVFEALTTFNASDNIQDFKLTENDKLDISDLLIGYDQLTDAITDFVQITESAGSSYLSVDADGGADNFVQVAYIYNETGLTDEDALLTSGNLIAA